MTTDRKIIVITGSVGTGKTTVSSILALKLKIPHLDLSSIALEKDFIIGIDKDRASLIVDPSKISDFIDRKEKETEGRLIVEGHYASSVVKSEHVLIAFVLRCHPSELKKRLVKSGFKKQKIDENVEAEILGSCLVDAIRSYGRERICEIDTTSKSPEEVAEIILDILNKKREKTIGKIDWLTLLEKEGRLHEFMKPQG